MIIVFKSYLGHILNHAVIDNDLVPHIHHIEDVDREQDRGQKLVLAATIIPTVLSN